MEEHLFLNNKPKEYNNIKMVTIDKFREQKWACNRKRKDDAYYSNSKKSGWTKTEVIELCDLVKKHGAKDMRMIANKLGKERN